MSSIPPCIILAGGFGSRLKSVLGDQPKCLAPIGARSFLEVQMAALAAQGIGHFILSLGHMARAVEEVATPLRERYRIDIVIEDTPLGTGGAVLNALFSYGADEALVSNGDTYLDGNLAELLVPLAAGEQMRLAAIEVADRGRFGGLLIDGYRVTGFLEKGAAGPGLINAGLYRLHRRAFADHEVGSRFSLETDVAPALAAAGALRATIIDGCFTDIGVPEDYRRFRDDHA